MMLTENEYSVSGDNPSMSYQDMKSNRSIGGNIFRSQMGENDLSKSDGQVSLPPDRSAKESVIASNELNHHNTRSKDSEILASQDGLELGNQKNSYHRKSSQNQSEQPNLDYESEGEVKR